jgi:hypothetical protein
MAHRIFTTPVAVVYDLYIKKVLRKGQSVEAMDSVICWLTQLDSSELHSLIESQVTFKEFFNRVALVPAADKISGSICGVRIQEIEDPLMKKVRYLDKVVDEVANGKSVEKICSR